MVWQMRGKALSLDSPRVMGVLNITPDSFSDGGRYADPAAALAGARAMAAAGADIIDVGAQSTRPGAALLSAEEEWARLAPCLADIVQAVGVPVSVDTFHPEVAHRALAAGAAILNDISGGEQNGMAGIAASCGAGMVFMRPGDPASRSAAADEVLAATQAYFTRALALADRAGLPRGCVCLDVGVGFGSSPAGDLALIARLPELKRAFPDLPLLVGASRKRVIADVCGPTPAAGRLPGTLALHTVALWNGASVVRVHDVPEAAAAARIVAALMQERKDI